MKKFLFAFYAVFLLGFALKFFHIHFNAVLMMIGITGVFLTSLYFLVRKKTRITGLMHIGIVFWLILLLITLKFFPFGLYALLIAILVSFIVLLVYLRNKLINKLKLFFLSMILTLIFYFIPTDQRYYILNIKWNYEIETDYYSWDKYSWFLYQNGKFTEAMNASKMALQEADVAKDEIMLDIIKNHHAAIKNKSWESYK